MLDRAQLTIVPEGRAQLTSDDAPYFALRLAFAVIDVLPRLGCDPRPLLSDAERDAALARLLERYQSFLGLLPPGRVPEGLEQKVAQALTRQPVKTAEARALLDAYPRIAPGDKPPDLPPHVAAIATKLENLSRIRRLSGLWTFMVAAAILGATVAASGLARGPLRDAALRYVPKEAEVVLVTSDVASVWRLFALHFADLAERLQKNAEETRRLEKDGPETPEAPAPCSLARLDADDLGGCFARIRREGLDALAVNGVDTGRGAILSVDGVTRESADYVLQLGVRDATRFRGWLGALTDSRSSDPGLAVDAEVLAYCPVKQPGACARPVYLALVGDSALISNSRRLLHWSLANPATNQAHARNRDALGAILRDYAARDVGRLALVWQPPTGAGVVRTLTARARGDRNAFTIEGEVDLEAGRVGLVDTLLRRPPAPVAWSALLERDTPAALSLQDTDAARFLAWAARQLPSSSLSGWPAVVSRLSEIDDLRALVVASTGRRGDVPDLLFGAWGRSESLRQTVARLRSDLYDVRDRAVLTAALKDPRVNAKATADAATLVRAGVLKPEPRLARYAIEGGRVLALGDRAERVADDERVVHAGRDITFLAPPLTPNDLALREEFRKLADRPAEREILLDNRGRLAAMLAPAADLLWIASDVEALKGLASRPDGVDALRDGGIFTRAAAVWQARDKIELFVDIARLIALGMLSPDSGLTEEIRGPLAALRDHPALAMNVAATDGRSRLRFDLRLLRWTAAP